MGKGYILGGRLTRLEYRVEYFLSQLYNLKFPFAITVILFLVLCFL